MNKREAKYFDEIAMLFFENNFGTASKSDVELLMSSILMMTSWWLRSPGSIDTRAAYVDSTGVVREIGRNVNDLYVGVRPAIWIDISKQ